VFTIISVNTSSVIELFKYGTAFLVRLKKVIVLIALKITDKLWQNENLKFSECTIQSDLVLTSRDALLVAGIFVPKNVRSRERKFHRVELSFSGTFAPRTESSRELSLSEH